MLLLLVVGISVTACSSTAVTPRPASEDATFLQYSDPDSRRRTSLKCGKWKRNEAKVHRSICRSTASRSLVLTRGSICVPPTVIYVRTAFPAQHVRPSDVLSCWPDGLELSPGFYLGSSKQHRLFSASTYNVLVRALLVHPAH